MFLEIPELLSPQEIERLREIGRIGAFIDGRATNPHSQVKKNLHQDLADPLATEVGRTLQMALSRHEGFRNFTFARTMANPNLTIHRPGMHYGLHSDAPFLPLGPRPLRADISCTIFLNPPESYEGGELSVHLGGREVMFKLKPGQAVLYPSNTLHEVKPVTQGERLCGITFIESRIPDARNRELLYDLNEVAALEGFNMSWENRTRLNYVFNSLQRMWGEAG